MKELATERSDPSTHHLNRLTTIEMALVMHRADRDAFAAVEAALPAVASAVDAIVQRLEQGGRLFYLGAGTSGRLGVLDASECPPTFNTPDDLVQGVIAGGDYALRHAVEGAEDDRQHGGLDLEERGFNSQDVLIGIAASGQTPYVLGGLEYALKCKALAIGLTCVPSSPVAGLGHISILVETGPEVLAGSTRLKAGTATKMILNMISTSVMVKLGNTYGNLMVNVRPTNDKLRARASRLIATLTNLPLEDAHDLLEVAGSVKTAVVMQRFGLDRSSAEQRLALAGGRLDVALEQCFTLSERHT